MSSDQLTLPYGWVQEFDPKSNHPFWVDTKADPPRAIWTHPYEDEQYLKEHPDVKEKVGNLARQEESNDTSARRHSFNGHDSASMVPEEDQAQPDSSKKGKQKRGFFGKLKDRAIGTKEEREAYRKEQERLEIERRRQYQEMLNAQRQRYAQQEAQRQALYNQQGPYAGGSCQPRYGPPPGDPYLYGRGYGGGYGGGYGYGYGDYGYQRGRGRGRNNNSALPLLGALAGGLILGDLLF